MGFTSASDAWGWALGSRGWWYSRTEGLGGSEMLEGFALPVFCCGVKSVEMFARRSWRLHESGE